MKKLIFLSILISLIFGCTVTKDNHAVARVIGKPALVKKIVQYDQGAHPYIPIEPVYIKGKDSVIEVPVPVDVVRDSLIMVACPTLNLDSLKKALTHTIVKVRVDTTKVEDPEKAKLIISQQYNISTMEGQYNEKSNQADAYKKESSLRLRWMIGEGAVGAILLIVIILLVISLVKKSFIK